MKMLDLLRIAGVAALAGLLAASTSPALAQSVVRIGMTAADIPRTLGQPDQGFEGNRFTGNTMYEGLTIWDLSSADKASVVIPGLATEWASTPDDKTKWIFKLRPGVKFHDGSDVQRRCRGVERREGAQAGRAAFRPEPGRRHRLAHAEPAQRPQDRRHDGRADDGGAGRAAADQPHQPVHGEPGALEEALRRGAASVTDPKERAKQAWDAFSRNASGTGPWKMDRFVPRERLELVKNDAYWDAERVARRSIGWCCCRCPRRMRAPRRCCRARSTGSRIRRPMPCRRSSSAASSIYQNEQPHVWPWQFSRIEGSPWNDIRVRKAANLCVDRNAMKDGLLGGLMVPATGTFEPGHPWRGNPKFQIKYDPNEARKLMAEAGFSKDKKLKVKTQTSASGSGQMLPLPMNEFMQQSLAECFFDVELDVIEWNTLFTNWRKGAKDESARGAHATNVTYAAMDPFFAMIRFLDFEDGAAGVQQLGLHQRSGVRQAGRSRAHRLRSGRARQGARRPA